VASGTFCRVGSSVIAPARRGALPVGVGWMVFGLVGYAVYRRRQGLDIWPSPTTDRASRGVRRFFVELEYRSAIGADLRHRRRRPRAYAPRPKAGRRGRVGRGRVRAGGCPTSCRFDGRSRGRREQLGYSVAPLERAPSWPVARNKLKVQTAADPCARQPGARPWSREARAAKRPRSSTLGTGARAAVRGRRSGPTAKLICSHTGRAGL